MQTPQIVQCSNCESLKQLLCQIDDSLYKRIRGKWHSVIYNSDIYFNSSVYKDLLRYKRILQNRIYDPLYPNTTGNVAISNIGTCCNTILPTFQTVDVQDIIGRVTILLNK